MRVWKIRLLRFAVGEACGSRRVAQPEALQKLRIVIKRPTLPRPHAEKRTDGPGIPCLRQRREAVLADIGRAKSRMALLDVGGLRAVPICPILSMSDLRIPASQTYD